MILVLLVMTVAPVTLACNVDIFLNTGNSKLPALAVCQLPLSILY